MRLPFSPLLGAGIVALSATTALSAQFFVRYSPLPRTVDLLVVDSSFDGVWRLSDLNQDDDFNDAGEVNVYYDDVTGGITLTNPTCIAVAPNGVAYIADSTIDIVLRLEDLNGDGDANDAGEATEFFNTIVNQSGVVGASVQSITADVLGNVFLASSNTSSVGDDTIIKLNDLNGDGNANDAGEAVIYHQVPGGGVSVGASIPTEIRIGHDGLLYYCENGVSGNPVKGVYQLRDNDGDGLAMTPGESNLYWIPPQPLTSNAFYWGLEILPDGTLVVTDHSTNESVFTGRDINADNMIDPVTESNTFYSTLASTFWDVVVRDDGLILVCEDQTPDRITALRDLNGDGDALDPNEAWEAYDDTVSPTSDVRPRGAVFMPGTLLQVSPGSVPVGGSFAVGITTPGPNQDIGIVAGFGLLPTPFPIRPFGEVFINTSGGIVLPVVTTDANGRYSLQGTIPNDASLRGLVVAFQAFGGDPSRFYTSQAGTLGIQ